MSRFQKLSQTIWHCQYHIVWVPKYRYRVLNGPIAVEVKNCIRAFSEQKGCRIVELNVQVDHVHLYDVFLKLKFRITPVLQNLIAPRVLGQGWVRGWNGVDGRGVRTTKACDQLRFFGP